MAKIATMIAVVALLAPAAAPQEQAQPAKEHERLKQLAGEWTSESEFPAQEKGKEPTKSKGSGTGRMFGDFWMVYEVKGEAMGNAFSGLMTVGWDAEKKKFIGTWVDTMNPMMWHYAGTLEGSKLSLYAEGPSFADPKKKAKFCDAIEFTDKDTYVLTSSIEQDGKWVTFMTATFKRKK